MLDRLARPWVPGPGRFEEAEDVLGAGRRPQGQEPVIRIGESPTAADRHEAGIPDFREDHEGRSCCLPPPTTLGRRTRGQGRPAGPGQAPR